MSGAPGQSPTLDTGPEGSSRPEPSLLETIATFDLVAGMTLFVVLMVAHTPVYQTLTLAAAVAAACSPRLRNTPWLWLGLSLAFAPRLIFDWYHNEDHVYLAIYWCTAVGLSRYGLPSNEVLKTNARRLVGLAFLFALPVEDHHTSIRRRFVGVAISCLLTIDFIKPFRGRSLD